MRVGAIPTTALEWIASRLNLVPLPAADALFGMLHSRIVMAGGRLGVFAALASGEQSADALAERLRLDPTGTRLLCDALVAARYLARHATGGYALTRLTRRYLVPASPHYIGDYLEYNYDQWEWVGHLERVVRGGDPLDVHVALNSAAPGDLPGSWTRYMLGLAELAGTAASEVAAKVPLAPRADGAPRRLLDIGGGHGRFSVALCQRYPDLTAEILDLPECVAAAEPIARQLAGPLVAPRVRYRAGDALAATLGSPASYDTALIFQLLHHLPPATIPELIARAVRVVRPGGWVALLDLLEPEHAGARDALAAYTALYFYLTSRGHSYPPEQIRVWLREAGCAEIRTIPLLRVPGQSLLAGRRAP